jgi:hypothetical protein
MCRLTVASGALFARRQAVVFVIVFSSITAQLSAQQSVSFPGLIFGEVRSEVGARLSNVAVTVTKVWINGVSITGNKISSEITGRTGPRGEFRFEKILRGQWLISICQPGYAPFELTTKASHERWNFDSVDVTLAPGSCTSSEVEQAGAEVLNTREMQPQAANDSGNIVSGTREYTQLQRDLFSSTFDPIAYTDSNDLFDLATLFRARNQHLNEVLALTRCRDLSRHRGCRRQYDVSKDVYVNALNRTLRDTAPGDLVLKQKLVQQLARYDSDERAHAELLSELNSIISLTKSESERFVSRLHDQTGDLLLLDIPEIPANTQRLYKYLPEAAEAITEASYHSAEVAAIRHIQSEEFGQAAIAIRAHRRHPEASSVLNDLRLAAGDLLARLQSRAQTVSVRDINETASQLDRISQATGDDSSLSAQFDALAGLSTEWFSRRFEETELTASESVKLFVEMNEFDYPHVHDFILETAPIQIRFALDIASPGRNCLLDRNDGTTEGELGALYRAVSSSLPEWAVISDEPAEITVQVDSLQCRSNREEMEVSPVTSTYIATYQSTPNPEYLDKQQGLQIIMQQYQQMQLNSTINPSIWNSIAEAAGLVGVTSARSALSKISPTISTPIEQSYTAERYSVRTEVSAGINLTLRDELTGFSDGEYISSTEESNGAGLRNVTDSDKTGLFNTPPALKNKIELGGAVLASLGNQITEAVHRLGERLYLNRASVAYRVDDRADAALANLLFADDFDVDASEIPRSVSNVVRAMSVNDSDINLDFLPDITGPNDDKGLSDIVEKRVVDLPTVSDSRAGMVREALPAVVTIDTEEGSGSGFFISRDGYLLTNAHVVEDGTRIVVRTRGGDRYLARIVNLSSDYDVALLKVTGSIESVLELGSLGDIDIAIDVIAIGSPLGLEGTVTRGIVSAIRQLSSVTLIQVDAPINTGNSGGPLLSEDGRVIGINTIKFSDVGVEGIGFAVSIDDVKKVFSSYFIDRQ